MISETFADATRRKRNYEERRLIKVEGRYEARSRNLQAHKWLMLYEAGMSKNATPPPCRTPDIDRMIARILGFLAHPFATEWHCPLQTHSCLQPEYFFHEQGLIYKGERKLIFQSNADLNQARLHDKKNNADLSNMLMSRIKNRTLLRAYNINNGTIIPRTWDKTTDSLKGIFCALAIPEENVRAFSINPGIGRIEWAMRANSGVAASFREDLSQRFRRSAALETKLNFTLNVEVGGSNGLHCHGSMYWPEAPREQQAIKKAIRAFSGSDCPNAFSVSSKGPQARWQCYASKHALQTSRFVDGKTFSATIDLRRAGRALFEAWREELLSVRHLFNIV